MDAFIKTANRIGQFVASVIQIAAIGVAGYFVVVIALATHDEASRYRRAVQAGLISPSDPRLAPPPRPAPRFDKQARD